MKIQLWGFLALLCLLSSACTGNPAAQTEDTSPAVPETTLTPIDQEMPVPPLDEGPVPTEMVSLELSTHQAAGITFDYPAAWMLDEMVLGSRAPLGIQLTSWEHEPGMVSEVQEGGTIMNIAVQLWDPKGDLEAFAENRRSALVASGFSVLSETSLTLENGQQAVEIIFQGPVEQAYFLYSTLGEDYLVASGSGDLESIRQVARSIR